MNPKPLRPTDPVSVNPVTCSKPVIPFERQTLRTWSHNLRTRQPRTLGRNEAQSEIHRYSRPAGVPVWQLTVAAGNRLPRDPSFEVCSVGVSGSVGGWDFVFSVWGSLQGFGIQSRGYILFGVVIITIGVF